MRFEHAETGNRVFLAIKPTRADDDAVAADAAKARKLMHITDSAKEFEIVYGAVPEHGAKVGIVTRFAFSVVQNLIALAETSQNSKAPIVTIPAG